MKKSDFIENPYRLLKEQKIFNFIIVFNWIINFFFFFEMRFLNLRINFFYLLRTFCPHLGSFFTTADRGVESLRFQVSIVRR